MQRSSGGFAKGFVAGAALAMVAVVCMSLWIFHGGFTARAQPTALEESVAHRLYSASIPARFRNMANQMPTTPGKLHEGMEHFADHCASCHANNGSGNTMFGRGLSPQPPDLRFPATQAKSDGELYYIIEHGIRMTGMPAFGLPGVGHDHGSWNLVLFIRHLPALTPQEELEMQGMNPITPNEMKEKQAEDDFLNGTTNTTQGAHP